MLLEFEAGSAIIINETMGRNRKNGRFFHVSVDAFYVQYLILKYICSVD
jgi:hypothetical protein